MFRRLKQIFYLMIGQTDYQAYVAHQKQHHPGKPIMTAREFFRYREANRYRSDKSRCC